MRATVRVDFGSEAVVCGIPAAEPPWPVDDARRWLDHQFTQRDCEPLRAMGKVLTVDKLVVVAEAIGAAELQADAALRLAFAQAASALVGRTEVLVNVAERHVVF